MKRIELSNKWFILLEAKGFLMLRAAYMSLTTLSLIFTLSGPAFADTHDAKELSKTYLEKNQIEEIVKDYILNNGDTVVKGIENYQEKQERERQAAAEAAIQTESDYLFNNPNSPVAGNPDGDVTLVEFFDYNCGYCKKAFEDIAKLIDEDKDLKVVFKEVPILSPTSHEAAKWSLASQKQDKYFEFHAALMNHRGQYDEKALTKIAKDLDLDIEKLKKDKDSEEIQATLTKNLQYMERFGIRGTPSFVIGKNIVRGFVGKDQLKEIINQARE